MKTRSNVMRCAMAAAAIAFAVAAHSLAQGGNDNAKPAAPAEVYHGHGCCGYSRVYAGHHGCHTTPPRHNRRSHHGYGHAHACYHGYGIKDADPKTFTDLGGGYAKDSRRAYYAGRAIAGADAKTFRYIGRGVAKDKRNTYIDGLKTD